MNLASHHLWDLSLIGGDDGILNELFSLVVIKELGGHDILEFSFLHLLVQEHASDHGVDHLAPGGKWVVLVHGGDLILHHLSKEGRVNFGFVHGLAEDGLEDLWADGGHVSEEVLEDFRGVHLPGSLNVENVLEHVGGQEVSLGSEEDIVDGGVDGLLENKGLEDLFDRDLVGVEDHPVDFGNGHQLLIVAEEVRVDGGGDDVLLQETVDKNVLEEGILHFQTHGGSHHGDIESLHVGNNLFTNPNMKYLLERMMTRMNIKPITETVTDVKVYPTGEIKEQWGSRMDRSLTLANSRRKLEDLSQAIFRQIEGITVF